MTVHEVIRQLPDIATLRDRCRALAMLDAILEPQEWLRTFAFDRAWGRGEEVASMRNGCGDDYSIVFSPAGAFARGFAHESRMSPWRSSPLTVWPGLIDTVPEAFQPLLRASAFCESDGTPRATVCFWRLVSADAWHTGDVTMPKDEEQKDEEDADGANELFTMLIAGTPEAYQRHFGSARPLELDAIAHVYGLKPLTEEIVSTLNPDVQLSDLTADVREIGYPTAARRWA
ncbi:hypothetical protein ACWDV4_15735 [Micromonospora sp. NPDC003197]